MKTLYTALFGSYDVVNKIYPQKGWRYVLFTDQDVQPKGWEVIKRPTPKDPIREARYHKIVVPQELRDDEVTIWVDANIIPMCDLSEFADRYPGKFIIRQHPRGSIFEE